MNKRDRSVRLRRSWVLLSALGLVLVMSPVVAERLDTTRIFAYLNSTYMSSEPFCVPADVMAELDELFLKSHKYSARCYLHMHYPVCEKE
jgi:hypothetical protein